MTGSTGLRARAAPDPPEYCKPETLSRGSGAGRRDHKPTTRPGHGPARSGPSGLSRVAATMTKWLVNADDRSKCTCILRA